MSRYAIAAFDPSGSFVGAGERRLDALSEKWLSIAETYLSTYGKSFNESWQGTLSHLTTKFTASSGAALVTFSANGILVSTISLLSGESRDAELSVLKMLVNSLRATEVVKLCAESEAPFEEMFEIATRPLMVVVPWGDERVSEQDQQLVQELSIHLAGAFFRQHRQVPRPSVA